MKAFDLVLNKYNDQKILNEMFEEIIKTKDAKEGLNSYKEKRSPNWLNE